MCTRTYDNEKQEIYIEIKFIKVISQLVKRLEKILKNFSFFTHNRTRDTVYYILLTFNREAKDLHNQILSRNT